MKLRALSQRHCDLHRDFLVRVPRRMRLAALLESFNSRQHEEGDMDLAGMHCEPLPPGTKPLTPQQASEMGAAVPLWALRADAIERTFRFGGFAEAMGFATMVAVRAEKEGHHPDMLIRYNTVTLTLSTHQIGGLSKNDFILAAKIDRLV